MDKDLAPMTGQHVRDNLGTRLAGLLQHNSSTYNANEIVRLGIKIFIQHDYMYVIIK